MFTKITKTLVAALVLAGASMTFVADASAAPKRSHYQPEQSQFDYRGNAGNTNGGA